MDTRSVIEDLNRRPPEYEGEMPPVCGSRSYWTTVSL
jgi:hypothetical protein